MIKIYTSTPPGVAKDFQSWSYAKYRINARKGHPPAYKERDVWWMSIGHNVGDEEDGKGESFSRPVFVVRGFSRQVFWGVPLSTTNK